MKEEDKIQKNGLLQGNEDPNLVLSHTSEELGKRLQKFIVRDEYQSVNSKGWKIAGAPYVDPSDVYFFLIKTSWAMFLLMWLLAYFASVLLFACLYQIDSGGIRGGNGSFADSLWLAHETWATIGYGVISAKSGYTHTVVLLESYVAILYTALLTGLVYAKFSTPVSKIKFSSVACISSMGTSRTLSFRILNTRKTKLGNASVTASVICKLPAHEASQLKTVVITDALRPSVGAEELEDCVQVIKALDLAVSNVPLFSIAMTCVHEITQDSPFARLTENTVGSSIIGVMVSFQASDVLTRMTITRERYYDVSDLRFDCTFADMMSYAPDGVPIANLQKLDQVVSTESLIIDDL